MNGIRGLIIDVAVCYIVIKGIKFYGDIREINGIYKGAKAVINKEKEIRL